jgi:DNA-binding SARP family transcriptional activator
VQFRVLGPLEIRTSDGQLVRVGAAKHRLLLAALLLSPNQLVSTDRLIEVLWSDRPPPSAANALRTYASALRSTLALTAAGSSSRLVAGNGGYQLSLAPHDLDLLVFEDLTARGQKAMADGDLAAATARLQRALALWRGRTLEDVSLDTGFAAELARLDELRLTAVEALVEAQLALGQHGAAVAELRPYATTLPLRERLQGLWIRALYHHGQQAEALAAYRTLRENLVAELGIEPSPQLQRLHRQILTADPALDPPPVTALQPVPVPRQLPRDPADFTGRALELARLGRLMRAGTESGPRAVIALDGVPGVGKSALAIHAAHRFADEFPDGQLYADLRGASPGPGPVAPSTVLTSFLRALGAADAETASLDEAAARFRDATADRRVLIVLDNASDAAQIQPLLPAGPGCAALVTSRRVLATLVGATATSLDVLSPADATTLLARIAGTRRVAAERDAVAEVARLCGYLPLALRIAGARLAARPAWRVRTLADRLSDAHRRLDELQLGDLGVRTSFQVSLDALVDGGDPQDRAAAEAFPWLGVLPGSDVGVAVAARLLDWPEADAEPALERLVDVQLLDSPAPGRYRLHDLLRLFAEERAAERYPPAERTAALLRVLTYHQDATREALRFVRPGHRHPVLTAGPPVPPELLPFHTDREALDWVDVERANLVAAVLQALDDPAVPAAVPFAIAQAMFGFFEMRGYWLDWIRLNEAVLPVADRAGDLVASGHARRDLGIAHEMLGEYERAFGYLEVALAVFQRAGDRHGEAATLTSLGVIHHRLGRYELALDSTRQSLTIRHELGDVRGTAVCLSNLGQMHVRLGQYREAEACYVESQGIFERLGDRSSASSVLGNRAGVYENEGRYADAVDCYEQALEVIRELGDSLLKASTLHCLGRANRLLGRYDVALACLRDGLSVAEPLGDRYYQAECLRELGCTWHAAGDDARARTHWRSAFALFDELGVPEADEVRQLLSTGPAEEPTP